MLLDEAYAMADSVARRRNDDLFATQQNATAVGPLEPKQDRHQGTLACPVLTDQRVDFARAQIEAHVVVGDNAGIGLADRFHPQQRPCASVIRSGSAQGLCAMALRHFGQTVSWIGLTCSL